MIDHPAPPVRPSAARRLAGAAAALVLVALAAACLWLPVDDMLVGGLFTWHLQQPQTWQGAIEALALLLIVATLMVAVRRPAVLAVAVAISLAFYLRRHHVDLPAVVGLFYLEALLAAGAAVERLLAGRAAAGSAVAPPGALTGTPPGTLTGTTPGTPPGTPTGILTGALTDARHLLAGVAAWCAVALTASAFHFGAPEDLRLLGGAFAVVAFAMGRRRPLLLRLWQGLARLRPAERAVAAWFPVQTAVLFARTNVTHYHDSLWYGLRGEYVLAPGGSLFDSLGLVHQVHYYPKLFELLLLPVSGLGDYSFVLALAIASWVLLGRLVHGLARELELDRLPALLATALAVSLPAVANLALTTKPDLFAALLLVAAALFFWRFLRGGQAGDALLGLAGVALAWATKITSLPYGALLVLAVAASWAFERRRFPAEARASTPWGARWRMQWTGALFGAGVAAASLLVLAVFTFRTWLLTGLPTIVPRPLIRLWHALGFELRYPVGVYDRKRVKSLAELPETVWDFLFEPSSLMYIRITWTGNVWLLLGAAAALFALLGRRSRSPGGLLVFAPVILAGASFALFFNNGYRGGDGNYYMFPLLLLTVATAAAAVHRSAGQRALLLALLVPFVAVQSLLGFVTAAWAPGTQAWDLDLKRTVFDTRFTRAAILDGAGLTEIAAFLAAQPEAPRVVGLGEVDHLRWLPARYESLELISFANPNPLGSPPEVARYLSSQRIDFLLLPRTGGGGALEPVEARLAREALVAVETPLYRLYDLRPARQHLEAWMRGVPTPHRRRYYDLVARFDRAELHGQRPIQAPWGQAIAVADAPTQHFTARPTLVLLDDTRVTWDLALPPDPGLVLRGRVGLLPTFEREAGSDGAVFRMAVEADGRELRHMEHFVLPGGGYPLLELPLGDLAGRRVRVVVAVFNRPGATDYQDWLLWVGPALVAPVPTPAEPAGPPPPGRRAPAPPAPPG